ncbi:hypothetical protein ABG768_019119, partial [Culter alburnus]
LFVEESEPVPPVNRPVQPTVSSSSTRPKPAEPTPILPRPAEPTYGPPPCRQHPYCWFSPHSHRLPPSCFVGHRAARALYLLHQQSRHSCQTSPRGHVGLATCLIVVDSGR